MPFNSTPTSLPTERPSDAKGAHRGRRGRPQDSSGGAAGRDVADGEAGRPEARVAEHARGSVRHREGDHTEVAERRGEEARRADRRAVT
eukprot:22589-Pelagococcus_subviridis.AAC.1